MSFLFFSSFSLSLSSFLSFYLSFFFSPLYPFFLRAIALRAIARVATLPNFSATLVSASHGPGLFHVVNSIDAINECQSLTKGYARNIGIFSYPRFFNFIICSSLYIYIYIYLSIYLSIYLYIYLSIQSKHKVNLLSLQVEYSPRSSVMNITP